MQSKIIEKILNEDNKALNELIEIVRDNAIFQDVMSDFREDFFIDDNIHGISHNERVALLACYIGIQEGINDEELRLVLEAAKYHDIGRGFEGNHGQYSSIIIDRNKEHIFPNLSDDEINTIKALCHGHSIDDNRYIEIAKLYGFENIEKFKRLLDIVKDADALDRVRLPRFGQLEEKYLRTETSKRIIDFSKELFREYKDIQQELTNENSREYEVISQYQVNKGLRSQLLFDGENYYLVRSLNRDDIESFDKGNGITPKIDNNGGYTVQDIMAQIRMQHRKTNLISMSEDPNIVLTYDKSNLHRFVLIKLSKDEIEDLKKVFSAGEYLLGVMDYQIEMQAQNAPQNVRKILERVDNASSIQEIIKIINGADREVATSLVESRQQYLSEAEQLEQSKKIAKCKVLNYYGLMRGITRDEKGKLIDISGFTQIMRNGYASSEWLYSGKIEQEELIDIPKILVDALALVKQAEFQGKDKEVLKRIEIEILSLVSSAAKIDQDNYQLQYSAHSKLKSELTIDRDFEITGGKISYRDTNMQMIAIRSVAEMTLNKRKIIELLQERLLDIDVEELLADTYCINQEMTTRQNNRGSQIGRNINFIISDYGYDFDDEVSAQILQSVENLGDEQLSNIILNGVDAQEISSLLIKTREDDERIQAHKSKRLGSKYIVEAIVEGYNWRKEGNSLTKKEKELLANRLLRGVETNNEIYKLYEAINKIQIGKNKFTQNDVFAIMINIAIEGKMGNIQYSDLLKKDVGEIQTILLENQESMQTLVLPISIDLLAGRGKEINKLKKELIDLGIDKDFIDSKDIKNVYVAKQIIDGYDFGRKLETEEKRAIIQSILNNSLLGGNKIFYLSNILKRLEENNFNQQEAYGIIINSSINRNVLDDNTLGGYYSDLILHPVKATKKLAENKNNIQTFVTNATILTALANNVSRDEIETIKKIYISQGFDEIFLESKDVRNIYIAHKIVNNCNFERVLNSEEKGAIFLSILNIQHLDTMPITTLIKNMEKIDFSEQECYRAIINLSKVDNKKSGKSYSILLKNPSYILELSKADFNLELSNMQIEIIISKNLSPKVVDRLKKEYIDLGYNSEELEKYSIENLYFISKIVNDFCTRNNVKDKEKKLLLQSFMKFNILAYPHRNYISSVMIELENKGLSNQESNDSLIYLILNGRLDNQNELGVTRIIGAPSKIRGLKLNKDKIKITNLMIQKMISRNLTEGEISKLKKEYIDLGISDKVIENKDAQNLYIAKYIVDNYNGNFDDKTKKIILAKLISPKLLDKDEFGRSINNIIDALSGFELSEQDILGIIINMSLGNIQGLGYAQALTSSIKVSQISEKQMKTTVDKKTLLKEMDEKDVERIKKIYIGEGISQSLIEKINSRNLYLAKNIVDNFAERNAISLDEKRKILTSIISYEILDMSKANRLISSPIEQFENIGLSQDEICDAIVKLAINGEISNRSGYSFSRICGSPYIIGELRREELDLNVGKSLIQRMVSENLKMEEQQEVLNYYKMINVDISSKDIKNLYIARQIIENYQGELTREGKRSLIIDLLRLDKGLLSNLTQGFEKIGLTQDEINGAIINLAVNKSATVQYGYSYGILSANPSKIMELSKRDILTDVSNITIQKSISCNLNREEVNELNKYYTDIGISSTFIEGHKPSNLYIAKHIVENIQLGRELKVDEKVALLTQILHPKSLKKEGHYISTLMKNLEQINLTDNKIYETIINLAVNGKIIQQTGYSYSRLLESELRVLDLENFKDEFDINITEALIRKSVKKYNKRIRAQDIAQASMELLIEGKGGSEICDDVKMDYQNLMAQKSQKKGSEQGVPN